MSDDNGILARIPGQHVAEGSKRLPDPATATEHEMTVEIDADHAGRVRVTYQRRQAKHRRSSHWFWHAVRAEAL